jgi:hypothetical protein
MGGSGMMVGKLVSVGCFGTVCVGVFPKSMMLVFLDLSTIKTRRGVEREEEGTMEVLN